MAAILFRALEMAKPNKHYLHRGQGYLIPAVAEADDMWARAAYENWCQGRSKPFRISLFPH